MAMSIGEDEVSGSASPNSWVILVIGLWAGIMGLFLLGANILQDVLFLF